jgi:hypothetical protein
MGLMFFQYASVLELLLCTTSPNLMKIQERTSGNKIFFLMNEYYLIIVDKSVKPLWTRKIDPKVPQESRNRVLSCKRGTIPWPRKVMEKIYNFSSSLLYNQSEQEREQKGNT